MANKSTFSPDNPQAEDDIARERDRVIKRMLATPPQPRPKLEKKPKT